MSTKLADEQIISQPVVAKQPNTRERILTTAAQLFIDKGYHGTSTQDIAEAVNIRKSSLFHHFRNKQDIVIAAIKMLHNYCLDNIFNIANKSIGNHERIEEFLLALVNFNRDYPYSSLVSFVGTELVGSNAEIATAIQKYANAWINTLVTLLEPFHGDAIAQRLAQDTLVYLQGTQVMQRIEQQHDYQKNLGEHLVALWQIN